MYFNCLWGLKKKAKKKKKPNSIVRMYLQQTFLGLVPQLSWLWLCSYCCCGNRLCVFFALLPVVSSLAQITQVCMCPPSFAWNKTNAKHATVLLGLLTRQEAMAESSWCFKMAALGLELIPPPPRPFFFFLLFSPWAFKGNCADV